MTEKSFRVVANAGSLQLVSVESEDSTGTSRVKTSVFNFAVAENGFVYSANKPSALIIAHQSATESLLADGYVLDEKYIFRHICVLGPRRVKRKYEQCFTICSIERDGGLQAIHKLKLDIQKSECGQTKVSSHTKSQNLHVKLLDGVNICFTWGDFLVHSPVSARGNLVSDQLCVQNIAATLAVHNPEILWTGLCLTPGSCNADIVLLLHGRPTLASAVEQEDITENVLVAAKISVSEPSRCQKLCMADFIPEMYASVVLCAHIAHIQRRQPGLEPQLHCSNVNQLKGEEHYVNTTLICTSYKQFLKFDNGRLQEMAELPFEDASDIRILDSSLEDQLFVIQSKQGTVCVVSSLFQVIQVYSNMLPVLIDDFPGCGTNQLLLLPKSQQPVHEEISWCQQFLLTDFSQHYINKLEGNVEGISKGKGEASSESLEAVAKALHTRLQAGIATHSDTQRQIDVCSNLVDQTCDAVRRMTLGLDIQKGPTLANAHLVPLLPEKEQHLTGGKNELPHPMDTESSQTRVLEVSCLWWKLVDSTMVIVAEVDNCCQRCLYDLQLVLTPRGHPAFQLASNSMTITTAYDDTQSSQLTFLPKRQHKKDSTSPHQLRTVKNQRCLFPIGHAYVASKFVVPEFQGSGRIEMSAAVTWLEQIESDSTGQAAVNSEVRCRDCGNVAFTSREVLKGDLDVRLNSISELSALELHRNRIALDITQEEFMLQLRSQHTSLTCIHQVMDTLGVHRCTTYDWCMYTEPGPLYRVRAHVKPITRDTARLIVNARDAAQALLFIHAMYEQLPDDVIILPANETDRDKDMMDALHAMHQELSLGSDAARDSKAKGTAAVDSAMKSQKTSPLKIDEQRLQEIRAKFSQKQSRLKGVTPEKSRASSNSGKSEELMKASVSTDKFLFKLACNTKEK